MRIGTWNLGRCGRTVGAGARQVARPAGWWWTRLGVIRKSGLLLVDRMDRELGWRSNGRAQQPVGAPEPTIGRAAIAKMTIAGGHLIVHGGVLPWWRIRAYGPELVLPGESATAAFGRVPAEQVADVRALVEEHPCAVAQRQLGAFRMTAGRSTSIAPSRRGAHTLGASVRGSAARTARRPVSARRSTCRGGGPDQQRPPFGHPSAAAGRGSAPRDLRALGREYEAGWDILQRGGRQVDDPFPMRISPDAARYAAEHLTVGPAAATPGLSSDCYPQRSRSFHLISVAATSTSSNAEWSAQATNGRRVPSGSTTHLGGRQGQ